jgi:hypothetical protein
MSEHLPSEQLLALVTLAPDDPERRAADAHVAECRECRAQWAEHEAMLRMLDASFALPALSPALSARVHQRIYPRRWPRLMLLTTWLLSLALALAAGSESLVLAVHVGAHCALSEALFAVAPLAIAGWMTRAGRLRLDTASFALVGGTSGLVGQWWLRSHCPVHGAVYHSFVFHFLVVLALSWAGAAFGRRILARTP